MNGMNESRKLVAVMFVAMAMTLLAGTTAHADAGDAAEEWSEWVCEYFEFC
jgi:type IV secretory pathway VirB2 component (pilin)